jgi:hypothetical protein
MKITLGQVVTGTITTGNSAGTPYIMAKGSVLHTEGGDRRMIAFAFGDVLETIGDKLFTGATLDAQLHVRNLFECKILGLTGEEAPALALAA